MMWTKQMSLRLSQACVIGFFIALWLGTITLMAGLVDILRYAGGRYNTPEMRILCTVFLLSCAVSGSGVLTALHFLLRNIARGKVFVPENVRFLRILSWLCFGIAAILVAAVSVHIIFPLAGAAAAFIGLLLRVVKNAFAEAVELKNENDLTV